MHNEPYYEVLIDGQIVSTTRLSAIAFLQFQSANLISRNAQLIRRYDDPDDKILHSACEYNLSTEGWETLK